MNWLLLFFLIPVAAQAAEADLFRDLFAAPKRFGTNRLSYRGDLYSTEEVRGTGSDLSLQKHGLEFSHVIDTDPTFFNLEARITRQEIHTNAFFPESRHAMPTKLCNVSFGGNYRVQLEGDRTVSAGVSIGSESDRPFYSAREVSFSANLLYRFRAAHEHDQWLVIVNESNTRGFWPWIPLPGIGYLFDRSDNFKFFLGVPVLGFFWRPGGKWMVNGFYFPVDSGRLEVSYFLLAPRAFMRAGSLRRKYFSARAAMISGIASLRGKRMSISGSPCRYRDFCWPI